MNAQSAELFEVTQPKGEPIFLDNDFGALDQYERLSARLNSDEETVEPHILAMTAEHTKSKGMALDEATSIATSMQAADTMIRTKPSLPVIYRLHCADGFGITPKTPQTGFRYVNTGAGHGTEHWQVVIDTDRQIYQHGNRWNEGNPKLSEDGELQMFQPLSFLTTGFTPDVNHFVRHRPDWMRYPNSHVVVGHAAVDKFLQVQARKDLQETGGQGDPSGIITSWAMLASASLKRLGYGTSIGKRGGLVHQVGIEGLAEVIAGSLGHRSRVRNQHQGDDDRVMRRLTGIEFDPRKDAQVIGAKAADHVQVDIDRANLYHGQLYGERDELVAYTTEVAGRFISHLLEAK